MVQRMLQGIILSKDRPAQCDLLIRSLKKNFCELDNLSVLYTTSNKEFEFGYVFLSLRFPEVTFIKQENYKEDVLSLVDESFGLTTFFTDDDICYQPIQSSCKEVDELMEDFKEVACFSLRLGLNTVIQDPYINSRTEAPYPIYTLPDSNFIMWDWTLLPPYMNFGYPCSVDGHIFRSYQLKEMLINCKFNNPNQQEIAMSNKAKELPKFMVSYKRSCVVNTPLNRVQETCANRSGEVYGQSPEEMLKNYLNGEELKIPEVSTNIIGCHQELDLQWTE